MSLGIRERGGPSRALRRFVLASLLAVAVAPAIAVAHGDLHGQIVAISQRIQSDPDNAQLILRRAELYREHEQWPQAEADYQRAGVLAPDNAVVKLGRGKLLLAMGRLDGARTQLDQVLETQPTHVDALVTRAQVLQAQGEHLAAAADYARAIANAQSPEPDFYLGRASSLAAAMPARYDEAIACLDEGLARLGRLPSLSLAAIDLQVSRGRFDDALLRLDSLRAGQPRQEAWLARRGDILMAGQRPDQAIQAWRESIAALDALPPRLRGTGAMLELRARVGRQLRAAEKPGP